MQKEHKPESTRKSTAGPVRRALAFLHQSSLLLAQASCTAPSSEHSRRLRRLASGIADLRLPLNVISQAVDVEVQP
jgi:hypothetical protein